MAGRPIAAFGRCRDYANESGMREAASTIKAVAPPRHDNGRLDPRRS